jgi:hypothetical protein
MRTAATALLVGAMLACGEAADTPIRVMRGKAGGGVRLTLVANPRVQINAQLKPALELPDGTVLRFDASGVSADSAYFTIPPELVLPEGIPAKGKIRASVCDSGEAVCRLVTVALR